MIPPLKPFPFFEIHAFHPTLSQARNVVLPLRKQYTGSPSLPHTHIALPGRARASDSTLITNGRPLHFQSGTMPFQELLKRQDQVYFDRTHYISKLEDLHTAILFCRPRRFGKSLTISMLQHFHGLQFAREHQSLYKDLDVQNGQGNIKPGQFFVLKFDFSIVAASPNPEEAYQSWIGFLNSSLKGFYSTYVTYLGGDFTALCGNINEQDPINSLHMCKQLVEFALQEPGNESVQGIYLLVDEYDSFANAFLEPLDSDARYKTAWMDTQVGQSFKAFWSTMKWMRSEGVIRRIFITGISPLSLSNIGSAFNIARNLSFHKGLAGICGLTNSELDDALKVIGKDSDTRRRILSEMARLFNRYHFCRTEQVNPVYNTETCLQYLQSIVEGTSPQTQDPQNSEISQLFIESGMTRDNPY